MDNSSGGDFRGAVISNSRKLSQIKFNLVWKEWSPVSVYVDTESFTGIRSVFMSTLSHLLESGQCLCRH